MVARRRLSRLWLWTNRLSGDVKLGMVVGFVTSPGLSIKSVQTSDLAVQFGTLSVGLKPRFSDCPEP